MGMTKNPPGLTVRLTPSVREALTAFAAERRWSLGKAAAYLIEQGLNAPAPVVTESDVHLRGAR